MTSTDQNLGFYRKTIGDIVVTAICDGVLDGDFSLVNGIEAGEAAAIMDSRFRPGKPILTINCFVVETGGKVVLIDSGGGTNGMFKAGRLPLALEAAGIAPGAVDTVLMSHLHPDHAGGLVTATGEAAFPAAEVRLHADEAKFWLETDNPPAEMKPFFDGAKAAVAPYAARMETFTKGEVAPGIEVEHLPGHTPGHCGFHIGSGGASLMMWTDVVHLPILQSHNPDISIAFDVDPDQARAQRKRVFDKVATDRILVVGSHLDFPTFTHLERAGTGYAFVPEVWRPYV